MNFPAREEFRSLVFETSPLPMVVMDAKCLRFIDCNPMAASIYGYSTKEEVLARTFLDVSAPLQYGDMPSAEKLDQLVQQTLEAGSAVFEWIHRRPNGEYWDAQVRLMAIAVGSEPLLYFSLVDITTRRSVEQAQCIVQTLVQSLNACNDLAQGASLVLQSALKLSGIDCGDVYLVESNSGALHLAASQGLAQALLTQISQFTTEPLSAEFVAREASRSESYAKYYAPSEQVRASEGLRGCVVTPIVFNGALIGLLSLASHSSDDIPIVTREALENIALQAGPTLQRLYAESALREREEIFLQFLDNSPVYVFVKDQDLRATTLSNNFAEMLGRPIGEIIGKQSSELFPPDFAASIDAVDRAVLNGGKTITVDEELNGRYYTTIKFPIRISGKPRYLAGYTIDITDRKRAEQALRESTAQFEAFMDNMPSMCIIKDEELRPIFFNRTMFERYPAKDWLGKTPHETFPSEVADEMVRADSQALRDGLVVYEEEWVDNTGVPRMLETRKFAIRREGAPSHLAALITDVTDRKRSETLLQNAQKLEALGVLAGGIAHDFNNLLSGIFGNLDLARLEDTKQERDECLDRAMAAMERARDLTRQLLTFAKGGAPVKKVEPLTPFLENTVQFALSGAAVDCRMDIRPDLWSCDYDRNQIGQAIDNIVINAVQAMPSGGTIEVTARNVTFLAGQHPVLHAGGYVCISIADHGIGIPREYLAKVFDPFFTTKPKGHGLGLATCYSVVKRHGGCIEVDSESGKGTTFSVYLPAVVVSAGGGAPTVRKQHRGAG
ncbi:MAG TPA: PAS domain-containing protein, partial [Polyangiaceae bacterium]|nr:PAS domain-containing protein [Polyangiaceae bacterium]